MKIVKYPHPALRHKAEPVVSISRELQLQVGRMLELMYENNGLGLAAPQVALPYQVLVMNFEADPEKKEHEYVAINPVILESKGAIDESEGCLSFPGLYQKVRRARTVTVQAYNLEGERIEKEIHDLEARVWQHEIDHLNGVLFIDKMGLLGRRSSKKSLEELEREFYEAIEKGEIPKGTAPKF